MGDRLPRKLAAILYADVAGYSRLTGADEDATHQTLSEYLDLASATIKSHQGEIMHYAGDAVLAKFDAVVDALASASEIQARLAVLNQKLDDERRLYFRIGVNLGDVIEDRGDIYGEGVNIAARLESIADPGGICISEAVRSSVNKALNLEFEDMGEQVLKNIEEPVRAYRVVVDSGFSKPAKIGKQATESPSLEFALPDRPSIAILPFKSLGSDPDQTYLADGIRFGIQATLVQLSGLFLVNASTLSNFRDKNTPASTVATELGVRYILEGAVQQAGDRIRATVQLTDTEIGQTIWAESYDRILDDVFDMQDEITREVITALNIKLIHMESGRIWFGQLTSSEAREYFYRGSNHLYEGNKEDNVVARQWFEELYRVQPDSVIGPSNIAVTYWMDSFFGWSEDPQGSAELAREWAEMSIEYEINNGIGHAVLGHLQLLEGKHDEALATCTRGVELRSSCPLAHGLLGLVHNYNGDAKSAVSSIKEALQLSKIYPSWLLNYLATAYRDCGEIGLSISAAREAMQLDPEKIDAQLTLCSDYILAEDQDQANSAAQKIKISDPTFRLTDYARSQPYKDPARLSRVIEALRNAGLPD